MPVTFFAGRTATISNMYVMDVNVTTDAQTSITEQLRQMEVGAILDFPIEKTDYLRTLTGSRLLTERVNGARWSVRVKMDVGRTEVTRVS